MSHYGLFLCLPPGAGKNWRDAADAAMAPFEIDDDTGLGEWDHWHPSGEFWVRPECVDDPLIVPSSVSWPGDPMRCDGGLKRALDLVGMRAAAVTTGRELWDAWQQAVRRHAPAMSLEQFRSRHRDVAAARAAYDAQPLVREVTARRHDENDLFNTVSLDGEDIFAYFGDDEQRFLERQAEGAVMAYALITTDGRWMDAEVTPAYRSLLQSYLDGLPDEAFVIELDCHS